MYSKRIGRFLDRMYEGVGVTLPHKIFNNLVMDSDPCCYFASSYLCSFIHK